MVEKRFKLRMHPKDNAVKIFDEQADDGHRRLLNLSFMDYEDTKYVRAKLESVVDLLNELYKENKQLRKTLWEAEESYIYERYEWSFEIEDAIEDLRKEFERKYWQDGNEI